jgi:SAM-dependent methyltransferase
MSNLKYARWLVRVARRLYTQAYERRYNIRTGFEKIQFLKDANSESQPYEPTDYLLTHRFIRPLRPNPSDVVFDIGCGMGRVLCVFARMKVRKCVGIELSPELGAIAMDNAKRLRARRAPIEVRVIDARVADYQEGTIFWLLNPFGAAVLERVLQQIQSTLKAVPRRIQIAYVNPIHADIVENQRWLRCTGRKSQWCSGKRATYWESV